MEQVSSTILPEKILQKRQQKREPKTLASQTSKSKILARPGKPRTSARLAQGESKILEAKIPAEISALQDYFDAACSNMVSMNKSFPACRREIIKISMRRRKKENPASSVVANARISSLRRQLTINGQMSVIRKYAKRRGLVIVKEYADGLKGGGKK